MLSALSIERDGRLHFVAIMVLKFIQLPPVAVAAAVDTAAAAAASDFLDCTPC